MKRWTPEDEEYLVLHWDKPNARKVRIAGVLDRSVRACELKMWRLSGSSSNNNESLSLSECAKLLGWSNATVRKAVIHLKIRHSPRRGCTKWRIRRVRLREIASYLLG